MIYIGKFLHATDQQKTEEAERRHGEFNLLIEADNQEAALDKFKERVMEFRQTTDLFAGQCSIYMVHLLELKAFPSDRASMLYYKSVAGDPMMPYISCTAPSGEANGCRILNWMEKGPRLDEDKTDVFLHFEAD
jgi:hypothetical protein